MSVYMNNSNSLSEIIALAGFVSVVGYFAFSAHSLSNSSILLTEKVRRNKFYSSIIVLLIFISMASLSIAKENFEFSIPNWLENDFLFQYFGILTVSIYTVLVCFVLIIIEKWFHLFSSLHNKFLIFMFNLIIMMVLPCLQGLKITWLIELLRQDVSLEISSIVILIVDIVISVLLFGLIYYSLNHNREVSKIYLDKIDSNIFDHNEVYGIVVSENESFVNILHVNKDDLRTSTRGQVCINISQILGFEEYGISQPNVKRKNSLITSSKVEEFIFNRITYPMLLKYGISRVSKLEEDYAKSICESGLIKVNNITKVKTVISNLDDKKYMKLVKLLNKQRFEEARIMLGLDKKDV